ncbi:universal stress protein [Haloferacaceae archaeon DSL9]
MAGAFERIVVATDDDHTAVELLETALPLATDHDAELHALSVVEMRSSIDHWDFVVERREDAAERALDVADAVTAPRGVSFEKRLRYGQPGAEIAGYAADYGVDLIVMGEPRRRGLRRLLHPRSVTDVVRQNAAVPVLTVPTTERDAPAAPVGVSAAATSPGDV